MSNKKRKPTAKVNFHSLFFFSLKKYQPFPLFTNRFITGTNRNKHDKFHEAGRPLTFVGKYKYSGLNKVSNSSHGKSVHTVYTTVGHSALPVSIFINVENQEPYLRI